MTLRKSRLLGQLGDLLLGPVWALLELDDEHLDLAFILPDSVLLAITLANQLGFYTILARLTIEMIELLGPICLLRAQLACGLKPLDGAIAILRLSA